MTDPCKESKCLIYPVCRRKRNIYCDDLCAYRDEVLNQIIEDYPVKGDDKAPTQAQLTTLWSHIHTIHPQIRSLKRDYAKHIKDLNT